MGCYCSNEYCSSYCTGIKKPGSGLSVYTGICRFYFSRCAGDFYDGIFLETYDSCSCVNGQPSYHSHIYDTKISSALDTWGFPGLSIPGSNDNNFCNYSAN